MTNFINVSTIALELNKARAAYGRCALGAYKDMGLRAIRDGLLAVRANEFNWAQEALAKAKHYLPHAKAAR